MSRHLSVATVIEKNRIASDVAFIILAEIEVLDANGVKVETLRIARNTESLVYQDEVYDAANFSIDITEDVGEEPSLQISAEDPSGAIRERMDRYDGGIGFPVRVIIVNTGNLDQEPELLEEFQVVGSSTAGFQVNFNLGVDNPLYQRFPSRAQFKDQCPLRYKGLLCKYTGNLPSCSYTWEGANSCETHDNQANFGGFRGLKSMYIS